MNPRQLKIITTLICSVFLILATGCVSTLELQHVTQLEINEIEKDGKLYLHVTGRPQHSGSVIKGVMIKSNPPVSSVEVKMGLFSKKTRNKDGAFEVEVPITDDLKSITFGRNGSLVWPSVVIVE